MPVPVEGTPIEVRNGQFIVPDKPIIPFIEGDGTGPDIWRASRTVFDAAVQKAYGGRRQIIIQIDPFADQSADSVPLDAAIISSRRKVYTPHSVSRTTALRYDIA